MVATNAQKENIAAAMGTAGNWFSLHTADPGTTGTSELTGGSPAYARKQSTLTAGSTDGVVNGAQVTFDVPAGTYTAIYVGQWSASTAGTFLDKSGPYNVGTYGSQGTILVTPTLTGA